MEGMGNMGGNMGSGMHTINDKACNLDRIDKTVHAGATEIGEFDIRMVMRSTPCISTMSNSRSYQEQVDAQALLQPNEDGKILC